MLGIEVLDQHESHAGVRGQAREQWSGTLRVHRPMRRPRRWEMNRSRRPCQALLRIPHSGRWKRYRLCRSFRFCRLTASHASLWSIRGLSFDVSPTPSGRHGMSFHAPIVAAAETLPLAIAVPQVWKKVSPKWRLLFNCRARPLEESRELKPFAVSRDYAREPSHEGNHRGRSIGLPFEGHVATCLDKITASDRGTLRGLTSISAMPVLGTRQTAECKQLEERL